MWKKIGITLLVLIVLAAAGMAYLNYRNRTLSPPDEQRITTDKGLSVQIKYSRPSVRDRMVFGPAEHEALQPYGVYWRLGANEATVFEFNQPVVIDGVRLEAGTYGAYAIPGPDSFLIALNETWDRWGYSEPDYSRDVVKTMVPVIANDHTEQFTIQLGETEDGVRVIFMWDDLKFMLPIRHAKN